MGKVEREPTAARRAPDESRPGDDTAALTDEPDSTSAPGEPRGATAAPTDPPAPTTDAPSGPSDAPPAPTTDAPPAPTTDAPTAPTDAPVGDAADLAVDPTVRVQPGDLPTEQLPDGDPGGGPVLRPGARVADRYRIVRFLARGGMGEVYEAEDTALGTHVALKTVQPEIADHPTGLARFRREIQVARTVTHPNVCRVFDLDHHDRAGRAPLAFYTMELLVGRTLAARLRDGPLDRGEARRILADLAAGLGAAHAAGVIHRDLKPANVIVAHRDGRAVITDFGLAMPAAAAIAGSDGGGDGGDGDGDGDDASSGPGSSSNTTLAGTPAYLAPEVLAGGPPTTASDLYALGVVMFEMQTGRRPQSASSLDEALAASDAPLPTPGDGAAWRDRRWERATLRCLARDPDLRPASAAALLGLVERRPWRWAAAGGLAVVAGAALVVGLGAGRHRATPATSAPAGGSDAAIEQPAPPPAFPPGPVTAVGGCAYAPAFIDDRTLVFDHTAGDVMDLYRLRAGASPEQLTRADTWEWRALPGLTPDEIVYVVSDVATGAASRLAALDLATGTDRTIAAQTSPSVAAAGGAYYYVTTEGTRIRRVTGDRDEVVLTMPPDATAQMIVASHDGQRLAVVGEQVGVPPRLCLADLTSHAVTCLDTPGLRNARPAFAPDDTSLLYLDREGVRRRWLDGSERDQLILPGVRATGGLAVAGDGTVVWSECEPRGALHDVTVDPPAALGSDDLVADPAVDGRGAVAYVRRGRELVVRDPDGRVSQVGSPLPAGARFRRPAFDPDGTRLAVTVTGGDQPGLYIYDVVRFVPPARVTSGDNDGRAVWLTGDQLLFDSWEEERPRVMRVGLDGGAPVAALDLDRVLVGVDRARGEVLVASPDETRLFWWNPATGRQRPGPPALTGAIRDPYHHSLAPGGRWLSLQLGRLGHGLYRVRLDERGRADGPVEQVWQAPGGVTLSDSAIDDQGHVVVAPIEWRGELIAGPPLR